MYLSRLNIKKSPSNQSLTALIDPKQQGEAMDAHHRLVWSTFTDEADTRDYLWRADGNGVFYTLSKREPKTTGLIHVQSKAFTPVLSAGDRLSFVLRANAVRTVKFENDIAPNGKPRRRKQDIVMHHMKANGIPNSERARIAQSEGSDWLVRRGEGCGFEVEEVSAQGYKTMTVPAGRGNRKGQPHFGVLDLAGVITVQDPEKMLSSIAQGFGSAKAFGCGLMMIRRA
jgi:CRISPR system Cascade subunit CasE